MSLQMFKEYLDLQEKVEEVIRESTFEGFSYDKVDLLSIEDGKILVGLTFYSTKYFRGDYEEVYITI